MLSREKIHPVKRAVSEAEASIAGEITPPVSIGHSVNSRARGTISRVLPCFAEELNPQRFSGHMAKNNPDSQSGARPSASYGDSYRCTREG